MNPQPQRPFLCSGSAATLQALAHNRDPQAWARLLELHGADILRLARRIVRDEGLAEDICQEALLHVRDFAGRFCAPTVGADEAARNWILRVTTNLALTLLRQRRRAQRRESQWEPPMSQPPVEVPATRTTHLLWQEVAQLPESLRLPLVMHYCSGMQYAHVSSALGCSQAAAKMRARRGLERLRQRLACLGLLVSLELLAQDLTAASPLVPLPPAQLARWQSLLQSPRQSKPLTGGIPLVTKISLLSAILCTTASVLVFALDAETPDPKQKSDPQTNVATATNPAKPRSISLEVKDLTLAEACQKLALLSGVEVSCDPQVAKNPIAYLKVEQTSPTFALEWLGKVGGAQLVIIDGKRRMLPNSPEQERVGQRVYNLRDFAFSEEDGEQLARMVRERVCPEDWEKPGTASSYENEELSVTQTPKCHAHIAQLLLNFRAERKVSFEFNDTALADVCVKLSSDNQLLIACDAALAEKKVDFKESGPLFETLENLGESIGAEVKTVDGSLKLLPRGATPEDPTALSLRLYEVTAILQKMDDAALAAEIRSTVAPESWTNPEALLEITATRLAVVQSAAVHRQLKAHLARLNAK